MKHLCLLLVLFSLANVHAQVAQNKAPDAGARVVQVFRDKKHVIAEFTKDPGTIRADLVITTPKGNSCEGQVLQQQGKKVRIDFSQCPDFADIKPGMTVTRSSMEAPEKKADTYADLDAGVTEGSGKPVTKPRPRPKPQAQPQPQAQPEAVAEPPPPRQQERDHHSQSKLPYGIRIVGGLYYAISDKLKFENLTGTASGANYSGSDEFTSNGTFGILAEAMIAEPNSWGVSAGLAYEFKRNFNVETINTNVGNQTGSPPTNPTMTVTLINANAIYRWNEFYIPFGLNYSFVNIGSPTVPLRDASGYVGVQFGRAWFFTDFLSVEAGAKEIGVSTKSETYSTNTVNAGNGSQLEYTITVKGLY